MGVGFCNTLLRNTCVQDLGTQTLEIGTPLRAFGLGLRVPSPILAKFREGGQCHGSSVYNAYKPKP